MARKFLTSLDLSLNELLNARIQNLGTAPATPLDGLVYFNTATKKYLGYANGSWIDFGGTSGYTKAETDGAITTQVTAAISALVNGAGTALDTLNELAAALGNDPNFATTMTTAIGNKVDKVAGKDLSTNDFTTLLLNKLNGIADGANLYTHPVNHLPSIITQDANNRFVTDIQISDWGSRTKKFTASVGNNSLTTIPITHNLNSREVIVSLVETASPYNAVITDVQMTSVNVVTLFFATPPTNGQYTVTIIG